MTTPALTDAEIDAAIERLRPSDPTRLARAIYRAGFAAGLARARGAVDSERYRFLRDIPVYDTGLAVADVPSERRDVNLLQGPALDNAVDAARQAYTLNRAAPAPAASPPREPVAWMVGSDPNCAAVYNAGHRDEAFDAARRWGRAITGLCVFPGAPELTPAAAPSDAPTPADPMPATEQINAAAIVEMLRGIQQDKTVTYWTQGVARVAADAIASLRAENARLTRELMEANDEDARTIARQDMAINRERARAERLAAALRCTVTKNPCGTDTWAVGHDCKCVCCQAWLADRAARAAVKE